MRRDTPRGAPFCSAIASKLCGARAGRSAAKLVARPAWHFARQTCQQLTRQDKGPIRQLASCHTALSAPHLRVVGGHDVARVVRLANGRRHARCSQGCRASNQQQLSAPLQSPRRHSCDAIQAAAITSAAQPGGACSLHVLQPPNPQLAKPLNPPVSPALPSLHTPPPNAQASPRSGTERTMASSVTSSCASHSPYGLALLYRFFICRRGRRSTKHGVKPTE